MIVVANSPLSALVQSINCCGSSNRSSVFLLTNFPGGVTQHPLGAGVEKLNDARGVGRDNREVGAVENRFPQESGSRAEPNCAPFPGPIRRTGFGVVNRGPVHGIGHDQLLSIPCRQLRFGKMRTATFETYAQLSSLHFGLDCSAVIPARALRGADGLLCIMLHLQYDAYEIDRILGAELLHDVLAMHLDRSPAYPEIPGGLLI